MKLNAHPPRQPSCEGQTRSGRGQRFKIERFDERYFQRTMEPAAQRQRATEIGDGLALLSVALPIDGQSTARISQVLAGGHVGAR